jgi:methyl-accepting chemotaxis protein
MESGHERLGLWQPGIWLARQIRFPVKLGVVAATLLIPLIVVIVMLVQRQGQESTLTRAEIEGMSVIRPLMRVVTLVQKHRGQSNLLLAGNTGVQADLEQTRSELARADADTDAALKAAGSFDAGTPWQPLAARLRSLAAETQSAKAEASFKLHGELVQDLRHFVYAVGDLSGLLYDADPAAYLLMDMVVSRTLPWTEQIGQLRGAGAGSLAQAAPQPAADAAMLIRISQLTAVLGDMRFNQELLKGKGEADLGLTAAIEASERFGSAATAAFTDSASQARDPAAFFAAGTRAIDAALAAQTQMGERLDKLLAQRVSALTFERTAMLAGFGLGFAALIYVLASLYKSFSIDLGRLRYAMEQIAAGNLRVVGSVRTKDEIGDLATLLRSMISHVSAMVAAVGSEAALVAHVGRKLNAGNRDLSDRTEQQAANLEQTAASVHELASTVEQNAQTASEVNRQAISVRDIAEAGAQSMATSIASVEAIQASAQKMSEIIGVIDGLAFQTNILALNAAVEAARAGEQGRGFAVVASEVRSLAQRSAASAREIRSLIQDSSTQVESSVARIRTAGAGMTRVVTGIQSVSASISQISSASAEQSTGLSEISAAVAQLDEITQQNAQMVERAVAQSNSLENQAGSLTNAIRSFKLQQGVAGEAMALVERAIDYRKGCGSRESFLRDLTDKAHNFHDRDMYVFVLDNKGTYLAFGGNAAKVGTRVQDIAGIDGAGLVDDILQQAAIEPGWVEYDITNPSTGIVQAKMSYVRALDGLAIGCGVYKSLVTS